MSTPAKIVTVLGDTWTLTMTETEYAAWVQWDEKRPDLAARIPCEQLIKCFLTNHRMKTKTQNAPQ